MSVCYVLSAPRSGSTLLSVLLAQHLDVYCPPEPWLLLGLDALGRAPREHPSDAKYLTSAIDEVLGKNRTKILSAAAQTIYQSILEEKNKKIFVDKTPRYYLCRELLSERLVDCKSILLLRNPLDIAASYVTTWNIDVANIVLNKHDSPVFFDYILSFRYFLELQAHTQSLILYYEDLVRNPEIEMERVYDYLNLQYSSVPTSVYPQQSVHTSTKFGDKKILASSAVHSNSIDSYRGVFNRDEISVLVNSLGKDTFSRLGYENVYKDACEEFAIDELPHLHEELVMIAESYLASREMTYHTLNSTSSFENNVVSTSNSRSVSGKFNFSQIYKFFKALR